MKAGCTERYSLTFYVMIFIADQREILLPPPAKGPGRISEVMKDANVSFQWDYPYDDYFTYKGGLGGTTDDEPFTCMRDVRRHGQDVTLTLTVDPNVSDEHLIAIAKDIRK